jgi:2-methylisocitrate lyase-like PEP mutase family enzyme
MTDILDAMAPQSNDHRIDQSGDHAKKVERFRALHDGPRPLLLANVWDQGSAKLLTSLGFVAVGTTSNGYAATLGRHDGAVSGEEALAHAASIVATTDVPVSADLENGFGDDPASVAETVRRAVAVGLAGCSVEDFTTRADDPIYDLGLASERVAAAAEAAAATSHGGGTPGLVLTARAENYLHGRPDLADTITRLQAYQEAGADVLYAPGLTRLADLGAIVTSVDRPVNVLALPGVPSVPELAAIGVRRVSVGGSFLFTALGAVVEAARELRDEGTYSYWARAAIGSRGAAAAF